MQDLCTATGWTSTQLKPTLNILCEQIFTENLCDISEIGVFPILKRLEKNFYPETCFTELKQQLEKLRVSGFPDIKTFFEEFNAL